VGQEVQSEFVYFHEKIRKTAKKVSGSSDLLRKGHDFPGQALYKGPKIVFFKIAGLWVSNDADFNLDLKNINLP
jgi:hypothetical protein